MSDETENVGRNPPSLARSKKNNAPKPVSKPLSADELIALPETVNERIDYIADIMSELRWVRGKTGKILSKVWGLSQSTIDGYASEASRTITGVRDEAVRDITVVANKMLRDAMLAGDVNGVWKMADTLAKVTGAHAPTKQEVTAFVGTATPKTARELMADVFKGDVGKNVLDDSESETVKESGLESDELGADETES